RYALVRTLDNSAEKSAKDTAAIYKSGKSPATVLPTTGGVIAMQVVDADDRVIAVCCGADRVLSLLTPDQLQHARNGRRYNINNPTSNSRQRVVAEPADDKTVLVVTDLKGVDDSVRLLGRVALIGGPPGVLLMALATYGIVSLSLRPVAALRHGAAAITAAGLADQRLPMPSAQDEIHRLAVTLNAMLDRIDVATQRQRTFVGDAAHELRSPLASLRVQLEVARRLGPETDLHALVDDVLVDVDRLDRLVEDLLALARLSEAGGALPRSERVDLHGLITDLVGTYGTARVPVTVGHAGTATVIGDPDGLRRVAVNLVDNAVRYARTGVTVDIEPRSSTGRPTVTLLVTDDGPGIPPNERERVFDRFYRVQASRSRDTGGTGLGLAIVRDVVRAHGGTVRLIANPAGQGTQAVVALPAELPPS
ncbi:MAG TPA: HAMP domain-containing sensor histidine kinase, partial [Jatrophihabitantaceae bacterium]|nr:HAMP domain-containing sensor histidine kinase [Jatrophihabitantaceae bacterium]